MMTTMTTTMMMIVMVTTMMINDDDDDDDDDDSEDDDDGSDDEDVYLKKSLVKSSKENKTKTKWFEKCPECHVHSKFTELSEQIQGMTLSLSYHMIDDLKNHDSTASA